MSALFNDDFLDTLSVVGFIIGVMNYNENLSQSDKDDMLQHVSNEIQLLLEKLEKHIDEQNQMLKEILSKLDDKEEQNDATKMVQG